MSASGSAEDVFEVLGHYPAAVGTEAPPLSDRELVANILNRFFCEVLDQAVLKLRDPKAHTASQASDDRVRVELLEILGALVTNLGKAPAPVLSLINAPFRNERRRSLMMEILESDRILRTESRNGIVMAEIRHDFLIQPIQRAVRESLLTEQHGRLIAAQAVLSLRIQAVSDDLLAHLLTAREFADISDHLESLNWGYLEPGWRLTPGELMLRSALMVRDIDAEVLASCAMLAQVSSITSAAKVPASADAVLTIRMLKAVDAASDSENFSLQQLLVIIRSHLELGEDAERSWIEYWTNRWKTVKGIHHE